MTESAEHAVPDPSKAESLADFVTALQALRWWAGGPSYRVLAKQVGALLRPPQTIAHTTVSDLFQVKRRRLDVDLVTATVRALGVDEPHVAEWRAACNRVQASASAGGPSGVHQQLPSALATFTGRTAEVERLLAVAQAVPASDAPRTVAICAVEGMGGIGKTQLALQVAHLLVQSGRHADVQLYANLRGFDPDRPPADPAAVLDAFLRQLGVAPQHLPETLDERAAEFRDLLYRRNALVVLDNAADEQHVRDLIPAGPDCLVLITSRRSMAGLDDATVLLLDVLDPEDSIRLLERVAGAERVRTEPEAARRVAELCAGLPLAVSLAAARLRSRPAWRVQDLADRLERGLGEISAGARGVAAVFELSYRGLPEAMRRLFRYLGINPGLDVTAESAAALAGIPVDEADRLLELLQDEHLVQQRMPGRYEMHDLVRAFAAETCRGEDSQADRNAALTRWLDWYLHSVYAAMEHVNRNRYRNGDLPRPRDLPVAEPADGEEARAWLSAERANLLAATRYGAVEGWTGHAWRMTQALWSYYYASGLNSDWAQSVRHGLAAAEADGNTAAQAEMWHARGNFEAVVGRFDRSLPYVQEALRLRKTAGDPAKTAATLGNLACIQSDMGRFRQGMATFHEALALLRTTGDRHAVATCLHNMGIGATAMGRHLEALDLLTEARERYREGGDEDHQTFVSIAIGVNASYLGDHDRAAAEVSRAVALAEQMGAARRLAPAVNVLGMLATERCDHEEAARMFRRALEIARDIGDWGEETEAVYELGVNALRAGDPSGALEFLDQAAALLDGRRYHRWILLLPQQRGDALLALGDLAGASELYQWVLASEEDSETVVRGRAAYGMARVALAQSPPDHRAAEKWLREAEVILDEAQLPQLQQTVAAALTEVEAELSTLS